MGAVEGNRAEESQSPGARPKPRLLGVAASLRNARWGAGGDRLIDALKALPDADALFAFLQRESEICLENFVAAGRAEGKDFLEIYQNLRRTSGEAGLSNSEVALAAALWAAYREGAEIEHLSLVEHFSPSGRIRGEAELRAKLAGADGLLISGPVYFGDRGSVAESLIEFIGRDPGLARRLRGKLYAGIAVGAKRNGGQETTLIYQMLDMLGMGMLAVGNDSDTTSQYGGTAWAGDVGTMHKDRYGLDTSMGTGRRMARVMRQLASGAQLAAPPRALFLLLQEARGIGHQVIERLLAHPALAMDATVLDLAGSRVRRCLACDVCPTEVDVDERYRCIIQSGADDMASLHPHFLGADLIVPLTVSVRDRTAVVSNYQTFIERTRYLRRGDYVFSDLLAAPLVLEEPGAQQSMAVRMATSFVRHHTVLSKPLVAFLDRDQVVDFAGLAVDFAETLARTTQLAAGRLAAARSFGATRYNPVGYVLSAEKDKEDERLRRRERMVMARRDRQGADAIARLRQAPPQVGSRPVPGASA